jgi:hypothetical protein
MLHSKAHEDYLHVLVFPRSLFEDSLSLFTLHMAVVHTLLQKIIFVLGPGVSSTKEKCEASNKIICVDKLQCARSIKKNDWLLLPHNLNLLP